MSLFSPRIRTKELAPLCRRLSTSLEAGIDARTVWRREAAGAGRPAAVRRYRILRDGVAAGESLADALAGTGDFFPTLFIELVEVGEQTGRLGEVFGRLAEHYEGRLTRQRLFLAAISWPLIELGLAVLIIGLVIWITGVVNKQVDVLGLGLVGNTGLAAYVAIVSGIGIAVLLVLQAIRRGLVWTRPIQRAVLRLPAVGPAIQTLLLARLTWSLSLTLGTGMDVRRAIRLSLRSTNNARYVDQIPAIDAAIARGESIYQAFLAAGGYPADFLDAMHVGEESGRLAETMEHLSGQYEQRARAALAVLMTLAGLAVWVAIAAVIIFFIFRLFFFYLGTLQGALDL